MKYAIVILTVLIGGSLGFAAASCGSGSGAESAGPVPSALAATQTSDVTETGSTTSAEEEPEPSAKPTRLEVWFTKGESLYLTHRDEVVADRRVGTAALEALLGGPTASENGVGTAIPDGTRLLGLTVRNGVATVDLTSEFESGGGSLSMQMRLGQVVYTLTQFPTVEGVRFELDGRPVDVFSGEGIILDHPVSRADYDDLLPVIVVESPKRGATVSSPVRVSGTANVFEANVTVVILDAAGNEIARTFTTATCGTGCRGDFSVSVPFEVGEEQAGTIVVHDDDAAGTGTPPHQIHVPVILSP